MFIRSPIAWSHLKFMDAFTNPMSYAGTFSVDGREIKHLDLNIRDILSVDNSLCVVNDYSFFYAKNLNTIKVRAFEVGICGFYGCANATDICLNVKALNKMAFYGRRVATSTDGLAPGFYILRKARNVKKIMVK